MTELLYEFAKPITVQATFVPARSAAPAIIHLEMMVAGSAVSLVLVNARDSKTHELLTDMDCIRKDWSSLCIRRESNHGLASYGLDFVSDDPAESVHIMARDCEVDQTAQQRS